jgi:DNA-binding MarR family transcriptional regulator
VGGVREDDPMTGGAGQADQRDELVDALLVLSRAIVGIAVRALAGSDADVTMAQFRTMVVIATRGPQRVVDISAELAVNPSTGTRMCERLVRKGLVARERVGADRREVQISLTELGRRVVREVIARRRAELASIVSALPDTSFDAGVTVLRDLAAAAGEPEEGDRWLGALPTQQHADS